MKLTIEAPGGINVVRGYSNAGVHINDRVYSGSVIVTAASVIDQWPPRRIDDLTEADLQQALALKPEVLLIGTGHRQRFPRPELLAVLHGARLGFEVMDTGAACRTYNVLVGERRKVAAALIVEPD
jgi:uncharacterized protein